MTCLIHKCHELVLLGDKVCSIDLVRAIHVGVATQAFIIDSVAELFIFSLRGPARVILDGESVTEVTHKSLNRDAA